MFSFAKHSKIDKRGYSDAKLLSVLPETNTHQNLEFRLPPQKRYLKLCDSSISFSIELPENYIPDNDFCNKLFENIEIEIFQDQVSKRGSEFDNSLSSFFLNKTMFDENYMESTMCLQGVYDLFNTDAESYDSEQILVRQHPATVVTKKIGDDELRFLRYNFIIPINHGLARTSDVLPAMVDVVITLKRAEAKYSILKHKPNNTVEGEHNRSIPYTYDEKVIPIIKPTLRAMYLKSDDLDRHMNQYVSTDYDFEYYDYNVRKKILGEGETDFHLDLTKGDFMPTHVVFAITPISRLKSSEEICLTRFNRHDLESFSVLVDNMTLENFPLKTNEDFYFQFLTATDRYQNPWSSGVLPLIQFTDGNFIIVVNFESMEKTDSSSYQVKLKFKNGLTEKFALLYMPVIPRSLSISPSGDVTAT